MRARFLQLIRRDLEVGIRTRRFLVLAALFVGLASLAGLSGVFVLERIEEEIVATMGLPTDANGEVDPALRAAIFDEFTSGTDDWLADRVAPLRSSIVSVAGFWMTRAALPLLLLLAFADSIAGDLRRRSLCYDTLRVSRTAWLGARFVSQATLSWALVSMTLVFLFSVGGVVLESWSIPAALTAAVATAGLLLPFHLCCLALVFWASASTRSATGALLRAAGGFLALFLGVWVLGTIGARYEVPGLAQLHWLNPGYHAAGLWLTARLVPSTLALLAITAVALAGARYALARKNL